MSEYVILIPNETGSQPAVMATEEVFLTTQTVDALLPTSL